MGYGPPMLLVILVLLYFGLLQAFWVTVCLLLGDMVKGSSSTTYSTRTVGQERLDAYMANGRSP